MSTNEQKARHVANVVVGKRSFLPKTWDCYFNAALQLLDEGYAESSVIDALEEADVICIGGEITNDLTAKAITII